MKSDINGQIDIFDVMYPTFKIDKPVRLIELFGGYGSQAMALERNRFPFEHYRLVEFDKYAIKSYNAIHGTSFDVMDIREVKGKDLGVEKTDQFDYIMCYSFPCTDLSVAGKMKGMSKGSGTRSGLLWEVERLITEMYELPQVLLMENVPQVIADANIHDFNEWQRFLEGKGYVNYVDVLNAKDYGVAQNRERCFMVSLLGNYNYKFPQPIKLEKTVNDYLEDVVDEKYYINTKMAETLINNLIIDGKINTCYKNNIACKLEKPYVDGAFLSHNDERITVKDFDCETASTITARYYKGVGGNGDNLVVNQVGMLDIKGTEQIRRGYDTNSLSPTITTMQGGNQQPKIIVASRGRNPINPFDRTVGAYVEQRLEPNSEGICNTLTSVQKDNLVLEPTVRIKQATSEGYIDCKIGGVADLSYPTSKTRRGRVQDNGDTCPTLTAQETGICKIETGLRIRKLTPRECGRLMDVSDEDITKMLAVNSDSQCYKQFGNSIVVSVLQAIFKQMF